MKINNINTKTNIQTRKSFKAKEYALVKTFINNEVVPLKLFELNYEDTKFLDFMSSKINLRRLAKWKNATSIQLKMWKSTIDNAILMSGFGEPQRSFLLTTNTNKPCGIISYKKLLSQCMLDCLASWPVQEGERVKLAGTTLVKEMFEDSSRQNTRKITLSTLSQSPVDIVKYYKKLNFEIISEDSGGGADMVCFRHSYEEKIKELDSLIQIKKTDKPKEVKLKNVLDVRF